MKRKLICKQILMAAVVLPVLVILLGVTTHAQMVSGTNSPGMSPPVMNPHDPNPAASGMGSGAPPGMGQNDGPFSGGHGGPQTFGGKAVPVDKPAVSTFPGEVRGVTRYPSGLPMPGAEVAILCAEADVDRTAVSGADGTFAFKNLKPCEYQLTARKEGFDISPVTKVDLVAGKVANADVPLGPSLAVSPANSNLSPLYRSAYRVQPASLRVAATDPPAGESSSASAAASTITPPAASSTPTPSASAKSPSTTNSSEQPEVTALLDEVRALSKRVEELEAERKNPGTPAQPAVTEPLAGTAAASPAETPAAAAVVQDAQAPATPPPPKPGPGQYLSTAGTITNYKGDTDLPTHPDGFDTFSYADWTWMNAAGRNKDSPMSTKYFTPEVRFDANYIIDANHPSDDTMVGSTEEFRSDEWQLEQASFGGDIRIGHVRGRILTMFGLWATATPRNDASAYRGQWDLNDAYRYVSEAWGGYHWDVAHGLNVDAGIFVSYIGLFSYYNFDNWAYQPSYVSSNTPWFFNGLRIQYFPTAKLKIEPWIINGWQSYARYNSKPGLGGQILWRPKPYFSAVFNDYGMGTDVFGSPGTSRIHADYSFELREYNQPDKFLDMAAASLTLDAGCQYGGGQNCFNDKNNGQKTDMLGYMIYQRFQFKHDLYGVTFGGGYLNNPGRYLTLLQPINQANAVSGSPYFTENPGNPYHAYDFTATFDYMPSQWLTFRWEAGYRHADVPYYAGRHGVTPPGGNTGSPSSYVCTNGSSSIVSNFTPTAQGFYHSSSNTNLGDNGGPQGTQLENESSVDFSCAAQATNAGLGSGWHAWAPDLRHSQVTAMMAIMTRF
jgi:hypothetical protein